MAGTYAHIILASSLGQDTSLLNEFPASIRLALKNCGPFCKLGSVGPDCPYVVGTTGATGYANVMHYARTADFVRIAIPRIYSMNFALTDTRACLAWIFGYTAHLVMDLTFHPVISRKFGAYAASAQNRKKHRLCELHQDVFLFHERFGLEIVGSDFLKFSRFAQCSQDGNIHKLSRPIRDLWTYCLEQQPREATKPYVRLPKESLKPDVWYATFVNVFQNVVTKGNTFLQGLGFGYPRLRDLDRAYTESLPSASGSKISYTELFNLAANNARVYWRQLALALDNNQPESFTLQNGSLDTGLADSTGRPVFLV